MTDPNKGRFDKRLEGLAQKSDPNKRVEKVVTESGLIIDVVKPNHRAKFPIRSFLIAILLFVCMKGAIFAQLGQEEYMNRVNALTAGNSLEVTAAFLLDADPVTTMMGRVMGGLFN